MGRENQVKIENQGNGYKPLGSDFIAKTRLNVNELMRRRQEEKRIDKKTNILIFSGAVTVLTVVIAILSL